MVWSLAKRFAGYLRNRRNSAHRQSRECNHCRLSIEPLEARCLLSTTITVDPAAEDGAFGSLRWAISQANSGGGDYIIELPAASYDTTIYGAKDDANASGDFDIDMPGRELQIQGAGQESTIIEGGGSCEDDDPVSDRVFNIHDGTVSFHNLTIGSGFTIVPEDDPDPDPTGGYGGGVLIEGGTDLVAFDHVTMCYNAADFNFDSINNGREAVGGGVAVLGEADVVFCNSTIVDNKAYAANGDSPNPNAGEEGEGDPGGPALGGGIAFLGSGTLEMYDCIVSDNRTVGGQRW